VKIYEILPDVANIEYTANHHNDGFAEHYIEKIQKDYSEKIKIKDQLKTALVLKDVQDPTGAVKLLLQLKNISNEPIIDYQLNDIQNEAPEKKAS
ncbi:MAG: hypothetical protein ACXWQQ_03720, partial [Pseudobdellovibrio sp.]